VGRVLLERRRRNLPFEQPNQFRKRDSTRSTDLFSLGLKERKEGRRGEEKGKAAKNAEA